MPLAVTGLLVPTLAELNVAVPVQPTTSPLRTPLTVQLVSVAAVVPSYGLSDAVTVGVTDSAVIAAVVVAVVEAGTWLQDAPPVSERSLAVTVLPVPIFASANVAVPVHATTSPLRTPSTVQLVNVAAVVPSYGLSAAVIDGVTDRAVIEAVVAAVVDART